MLPLKRKISAKAIARDIMAGADDFALMTKYRLGPKELGRLFQKLLCAKVITEIDLATREVAGGSILCCRCSRVNPSHNTFCGQCGIQLSRQCPGCGANVPVSINHCTSCGVLTSGPREKTRGFFVEKTCVSKRRGWVIPNRALRDIRAGFGDKVLLRKYQLSRRGLTRLFQTLADAGTITHSQLDQMMRPRSGLVCCTCKSSNFIESRFCGQCGRQLRERCPDPGFASPQNRVSSPDSISEVSELEAPWETSQTGPYPQNNSRSIREIGRTIFTVLMPLCKIKRSKKSLNKGLYHACRAGSVGKAWHLLDAGADIDGDNLLLPPGSPKKLQDDFWLHPLGIAAKYGHVALATLLLERGAGVNDRVGSSLTTALMETRSVSVAELLLDYGADVDAAEFRGYTALMLAACDGCTDLVGLLLDRGADVNAINVAGDTALMCASQYNSSGQGYRSPAFTPDYPGVVTVLLEYGADVSVRNKEGFTAEALAYHCGRHELVRILREAGACKWNGIGSDYRRLGCKETDSDTHIRTKFRELVKEYHPDAIQGKALPKDFIEFANMRLAEIQESYKRVMDHRRKEEMLKSILKACNRM